LAALQRQWPETRALLGGHLDLYQVHSATRESGVLEDRTVLAELLRLREEGVAIGLTVSGPEQAQVVRQALGVSVDGVNPFSTVQATWNLLESSAGAALAEAHDAGWIVIIKEALANGRLTPAADGGAPPVLAEIAGARGITVDAVAIAAVLAQPWVDVVLSGAVDVAQLKSNVAAVDLRLSDVESQRLHGLTEAAAAYWEARRRRAWT
jgi:aryl-alcohol dehydrogenase-like predicted oxidoreductase